MPRFNSRSHRLEEAKRLRRLRDYLQISQRDLASEFKVGHGAVSFWESGMRTIPGPVLKLIEIYESEIGLTHSENIRKIQSSWISRNLQLSSVIGHIVARFAGSSFRKLWGGSSEIISARSAQKLGSTLGSLKGLMMKIGQMISYTDFALSDSAREQLVHLQDRSIAVESGESEAMFLSEIGKSPRDLFESWEPAPFGVGSIGQVHHARLSDQTELAVKVQFDGICQSVNSDLQNVRAIEMIAPLLFRKQDGATLLSELKTRFQEECDYQREAYHQDLFAKLFSNDPQIYIPRVFPEFSGKRVLTSEYVRGKRFQEFLKLSSAHEKNQAGETILRMIFTSAFKHGLLNCDPNPGNYLFLPEKIAFIDFGCVKRLDEKFSHHWRAYMKAILEENRTLADELIVEMGYVANPKGFDFDYHYQMMKFIYEPWAKSGSYQFERGYLVKIWNKITTENPNRAKINLPRDWLFVNRLQWGAYSVLATLGADVDCRKLIRPLLYE